MGLVLSTKYEPRLGAGRLAFWRARFVRIYPAYWIVLVSVAVFWICFYHYGTKQFLEVPLAISLWAMVSNTALFGLDGLLFIQESDGVLAVRTNFSEGSGVQPHQLIAIAPAWTLSLELMFYLLAPWLVQLRSNWLLLIFALSLLLRAALWASGLGDDPWTYRFFPSEIGLFVLGMLSYRLYAKGLLRDGPLAGALLFATIALFPLFPDGPRILGRELYGAIVVLASPLALPWLFARTKHVAWDRTVGDLSYPVYLVHLPVMMYLRHFSAGEIDKVLFTYVTVILSLLAAVVLERWAVPKLLFVCRRRHVAGTT